MCFSDWGSAIILILNGIKPEHLNMLEGGIIAKLLEEKWKTFAQVPISILFLLILTLYCLTQPHQGIFFKRMFVTLLHLLAMSVAIYSRCQNRKVLF